MNWKRLLVIVILIAISGLALSPASVEAGDRHADCIRTAQAGRLDWVMTEPAEWTVIQFSRPFCSMPVVVVSGGQAIDRLEIGVVTQSIAWVWISGPVDESVSIFWQAMPATQ
jgi:hypothetical protein